MRDSAGGTVWRESRRGKTDVVWTCTKERCWVYWEKDASEGAIVKEETGKPKRRFMDTVREDITAVEVAEENVEERTEWRWRIRSGDP